MKKIDLCAVLGVEENQEIDVYSPKDNEFAGNPYYIRDDILYDSSDSPCDQVMLKLLRGEYTCEPVIKHLKAGKWYYYCFLPESYAGVEQIRFDKFNDKCVLNTALGNMFIRPEMARENMDKVRKKMDALRNGKGTVILDGTW